MSKILYLSCHSILEYDEIKLFNDLGHTVFSCGAYINPEAPLENFRPPLKIAQSQEDMEVFVRTGCKSDYHAKSVKLTREFVSRFDAVIVMHWPEFIIANWDVLKSSNKPIVWRTIGQSMAHIESSLGKMRNEGLRIVRYSPLEKNIPGYLGADDIIRFYKDPADFLPWSGADKSVVTFNNAMRKRGQFCNFKFYCDVTSGFDRKLYGGGNEDIDFAQGMVDTQQMPLIYSSARCYFAAGTQPASYTLNLIEAMMSGCPIVAPGAKLGSISQNHQLYEVHQIIQNNVSGLATDNINEARQFISLVMSSDKLAANLSANSRDRALSLFGKQTIKNKWVKYLYSIGVQ